MHNLATRECLEITCTNRQTYPNGWRYILYIYDSQSLSIVPITAEKFAAANPRRREYTAQNANRRIVEIKMASLKHSTVEMSSSARLWLIAVVRTQSLLHSTEAFITLDDSVYTAHTAVSNIEKVVQQVNFDYRVLRTLSRHTTQYYLHVWRAGWNSR